MIEDEDKFKGLLYSPEVLGGIGLLTAGLSGSAPSAALPSLIQGMQTASLFKKQKSADEKQKLIAHCEHSNKNHIADVSLEFKPLIILIGPEGDFSENEIKAAISNGYSPISLGEQILRTETAALYAIQTVSTLFHLQNWMMK
jgi:RsmE family RNA methyltransferase